MKARKSFLLVLFIVLSFFSVSRWVLNNAQASTETHKAQQNEIEQALDGK